MYHHLVVQVRGAALLEADQHEVRQTAQCVTVVIVTRIPEVGQIVVFDLEVKK